MFFFRNVLQICLKREFFVILFVILVLTLWSLNKTSQIQENHSASNHSTLSTTLKTFLLKEKNVNDTFSSQIFINAEPAYPLLSDKGKFIPIKRWVHIDLKGAPLKLDYFVEILKFLKKLDVNGIVIEWEDMFPFTGHLSNAVNGNAYSKDDVVTILRFAKEQNFEIVPLIQTFGHLEWILKLKEYSHLRDNFKYPQVICINLPEVWDLLVDMLDQVALVHKSFGLNYFHIGADEVFDLGLCNATAKKIKELGGRNRTLLWHIVRVAEYIKNTYSVTVLAWHDMLQLFSAKEIIDSNAHILIEPVLWSYAENLNQYLSYSTWSALKPFKKIWCASAYKGANGSMSFTSNPIHYIRNNEAWTDQMTTFYNEFDSIEGIIFTGWSRYDHFAVLCEIFPVGLPALAMSVETIIEAQPLNGVYQKSNKIFSCRLPYIGYVYSCEFPGAKVYELINSFHTQHLLINKYRVFDFSNNGWLSKIAVQYSFISLMYIENINSAIDTKLFLLTNLKSDIKKEMSKLFFDDAVEEFFQTYLYDDLAFLKKLKTILVRLSKKRYFIKRPFITKTSSNKSSNIMET